MMRRKTVPLRFRKSPKASLHKWPRQPRSSPSPLKSPDCNLYKYLSMQGSIISRWTYLLFNQITLNWSQNPKRSWLKRETSSMRSCAKSSRKRKNEKSQLSKRPFSKWERRLSVALIINLPSFRRSPKFLKMVSALAMSPSMKVRKMQGKWRSKFLLKWQMLHLM